MESDLHGATLRSKFFRRDRVRACFIPPGFVRGKPWAWLASDSSEAPMHSATEINSRWNQWRISVQNTAIQKRALCPNG